MNKLNDNNTTEYNADNSVNANSEASETAVKKKHSIRDYIFGGFVSTFIISYLFVRIGVYGVYYSRNALLPSLTKLLSPLFDQDGVSYLLVYFLFIIGWIICFAITFLVKPWRPFLKAMGTKPSGNTPKMLILGVIVGLLINSICIIIAVATGSLQGFALSAFQPVQIIMFIIAVLIQCSFEEFCVRCFAYQRILRIYGPAAAFIGSSLVFSAGHLFNPGITPLALATIVACGIAFGAVVYYLNSFWMSVGIHTGWNFCQGVLFGLPNSGFAAGYAIFRPVGEVKSGIAFDYTFGLEGSICVLAAFIILAVLIILWGKKHPRPHFDIYADEQA